MFLTDIGYSRFEASDAPSHVLTPSRSLESCRVSTASLGATVSRIIGVAAVLAVSLFLHGLALVVAERAYAPYRVSRAGEYVEGSTPGNVEHRDFASASSPSRRIPHQR